tara:strand:+ start:31924 stop:32082 length:159 start_codon:yes stop_codon:yes gene_type:complete
MKPQHVPVYIRRARRRQRYLEWLLLAIIVVVIIVAGRFVFGPFISWIAEQMI